MRIMDDNEYRRRLIARVEAMRKEAALPMLSFCQQVGPVAARHWKLFVNASDQEAWNHFSLKAISRIANLFGMGAELLQFKSNQSPR